jgi:hypothetical protein
MLNYPQEILVGGKATINWINNLSRQEIHAVIQDKEIPEELLPELVRNIPAKFLHNLASHKKLQPELRITILRRIFRADSAVLKNDSKIIIYNNILKLRWWSEKDHQITRAYIQEVSKLSNIEQPKSRKAKSKTKKKPKISVKAAEAPSLRYPPRPLPDSTLTDISKYLEFHRAGALWAARSKASEIEYCQLMACLMIDDAIKDFPSLANSATDLISVEDLISFRIELDTCVHTVVTINQMQDFLVGFKFNMRGEYAYAFLDQANVDLDKNEALFDLMVRACSFSNLDYESKIQALRLTAAGHQQYLENSESTLKLDKVAVTQGGMATITFSAGLNLKFSDNSFKYWKSSEDESYGFPVRFTIKFDRKTKLNICTVTITKLLPGQVYIFAIAATAKEQELRLEPVEFEVPQLPYVSAPGTNTYFGSVNHGAPVPIGGGGERRFMQF